VAEPNLDRLRMLAGELRGALAELNEFATMSVENFVQDRRAVNSAKYLLIVATEAALDVCNHLVSRRGPRSPADYADCIGILAEMGAIDPDLRGRLVNMARFRNLIVHLYWKVDDREVHRVIREDLGNLGRYLEAIGVYLGSDLG
jgi:uncharacterized protein YutE (UPF0331/DUF86 family)